MELSDLDQDERVALVALIKAVVLSDHTVSEEEEEHLGELLDAFGEDAYRAALDAADRRFADEDALKTFLRGIQRQEARELIYGTVLDMAMTDAITGGESPLLAWLASTWNVEASVEMPADE